MTLLNLWALFQNLFGEDGPRRFGRIIREANSPQRLKHLLGVYAGPVLIELERRGIRMEEVYKIIEEVRKEVGYV